MKGKVKKDNFDSFWLEAGAAQKNYTKFKHSCLREKDGVRQIVRPAIVGAILHHHIGSARVERQLKKLGFAKAAQYFCNCLPKADRTRKGNFGEVIASEHLCQRHNYQMPVLKLRFVEHTNMPARGEDIVAFRIDKQGKIKCICIGEAKTLERYDSKAVVKAHQRLDSAYHPHPVTLSQICNILDERGDEDLADQVDDILLTLSSKPFPRHNWIFVITGDEPRDPFGAVERMNAVVENLTAVSLHVPSLSSLVKEIFEKPDVGAK